MLEDQRIGIIVPAHNEERHILKVIMGLPDFVDRIYIIDDASSDRTAAIVTEQAVTDPRIRLWRRRRNRGLGASLVAGYRLATLEGMDIAVTMDGDGQMDPVHIPALLAPIISGKAAYSKGNRLADERHLMPLFRRIGNSLLTLLTKVSSGYWDLIDPQNGYTAADRAAMAIILKGPIWSRYGACNDVLINLNAARFRVASVVMPPIYRDERSGIRIPTYIPMLSWILAKGFFRRLTRKYGGLNLHPILLFFVGGGILALTGLGFGIMSIIEKATTGSVSTGNVILTALCIISAVQLLGHAFLYDSQTDH